MILFFSTIQFMHSSPIKIPPDPIPNNNYPPKPPLQHPTALYNVNMYNTHTHAHSAKSKQGTKKYGKEITNRFLERVVPLLSFNKEKKGERPWGWAVSDSWDRVRGGRGGSWLWGIVMLRELGATWGTAEEWTVQSCRPSFWQAYPFDGGALTLIQGGPGQSQRWVELIPVLIAVAALMGAATTAQAINRGASRVLAGRGVLGRWHPATVAPRCAAGAISRRRNRFGLDVEALSRGQGQIWTLT